jgi:tetratricopeptide (TPR) repeat protein
MKKIYLFFLIVTSLLISCNEKSRGIENENSSEIVFSDSLGHKISKTDLLNSNGTFDYAIYGIEDVPESAKQLHNKAREFGQNGNYEKSIELLLEANVLAPKWPYPLYDLAYTYLLKDDYENALKYYRLTDSLAPKGFYTSKTALYTLENEKKGAYKSGLYKMYLSLEWINNPTEKMEITKKLVSGFPAYAPGWKEYAALSEGEERENAINKGLELDSDIETRGMLLINKALVLDNKGETNNARDILISVIFDTQSTYGNIEMAKFVLNNITR